MPWPGTFRTRAAKAFKKKLKLTTLLGTVEVTEQVLQQGRGTYRPLSQYLSVTPGGYSAGIQKAVVDFGVEDSFGAAARRISRHHPVAISPSTVRKITLSHARKAKEAQSCGSPLAKLPKGGAKHILAEADGTMLPVVRSRAGKDGGDARKNKEVAWKEFRLCSALEEGSASPIYGCDYGSVDHLGYIWTHCAGKAGWGTQSHILVLSDGAAWIARQAQACFGNNHTHLLDLFHTMEYLSAAQKARGEWMKPTKRWLKVQKARMMRNRVDLVIKELEPYLEPEEEGGDCPVRAAWRYLSNHIGQFDYQGAKEKGLPVGSGLIESGHRHVLQKRLKLAGAWWTDENLDSMAHLRVLRANDRWDNYWQEAA